MITVEMSAPYLSLAILASSIEAAAEAAPEAATRRWETVLRELAETRAIQGHDFDTLTGQSWANLDIDRDVFHVDDLNACGSLRDAGLAFAVRQDEGRTGDPAFVAAFIESTNNGQPIDWQYWVVRMPYLSAAEAARLMSGLDPEPHLYADIKARPVPRNNVEAACQQAIAIERLAGRQEVARNTPADWLSWAHANEFDVHIGFALAVRDDGAAELDNSPADSNSGGDTGSPMPLARFRAQELAILQMLQTLGFSPMSLPKSKPGTPGAKAKCWGELRTDVKLFVSPKVFNKAWERLRAADDIADNPLPHLGGQG